MRSVGQDDLTRSAVHTDHLAETNGDISLVTQDASNRDRDIGRRQGRGRHLVEKRLEQVVVAPVDERDPAGSPSQRTHGRDAAEAAAHHDDMRDRLGCQVAYRAGWHWPIGQPGHRAKAIPPPSPQATTAAA